MAEYGPTVVHEPKGKATATFIMLHGLGDTGEQLNKGFDYSENYRQDWCRVWLALGIAREACL